MATNKFLLKVILGRSFIKMLGTGKGDIFNTNDADDVRGCIGIYISRKQIKKFDSSFVIKLWQKIARSQYRALLRPISSHGVWSGKTPFESEKFEWNGKVAAITRARIVWSKNLQFWRAVPPVTDSLHKSAGLISAIGIGEAPIGLQGTFSLWENSQALKQFAYQGQAHLQAIAATETNKWYSEELFARFAVIQEQGTLD